MQSFLVIFNGINFHTYLMENVLRKASTEDASVHAIFLRTQSEKTEAYAFPSDLDEAQSLTSSADALQDDEKIILHQIKLANTMADLETVPFTWQVVLDGRLDTMLKISTKYDLIFLDNGFDDQTPGLLTSNFFSSEDFIAKVAVPVEVLSGS